MQLNPMTAPVSLQTENMDVKIPILVSEHTPINLLGRDAPYKMDLQIWCSPDGVDSRGIKMQMIISQPNANVHWLGKLEADVEKSISKWGKLIEAQIPGLQTPVTEFHYTVINDSECDTEIEKWWSSKTKGPEVPMISQYIVIGTQGPAMQIDNCEFINN